MVHKQRIINDPVFGFITIPNNFLNDLIEHPYLQRLSRIKQMGLSHFVYPGAQHTRLLHSIGAMYLMREAIDVLRNKGHHITSEEAESALACILLHDVGHGPFSHALERTIVNDIHHEDISLMLMDNLSTQFKGKLETCISIFKNEYPKKFLHQLVSGQLDVDRLDYLRRDSFFTGVTEGNVGSARIIKILNIKNDELVVEAKGIYSIENFLTSRRLMYWQVYLHKTSVAAEKMLINTLKRAKELSIDGIEIFAPPSLKYFLVNNVNKETFEEKALNHFLNLDDNDIWCSLKVWSEHSDIVLSTLSRCLINRNIFRIEILTTHPTQEQIEEKINYFVKKLKISAHEASYFVASDVITTKMYSEAAGGSIDILYNDGTTKDISEASDMLDIELLARKVKKYYFSYLRL